MMALIISVQSEGTDRSSNGRGARHVKPNSRHRNVPGDRSLTHRGTSVEGSRRTRRHTGRRSAAVSSLGVVLWFFLAPVLGLWQL